MEKAIRVVVADDHMVVREGLRLILEGHDDIDLVGAAADGAAAVALVAEVQPAVVLVAEVQPAVVLMDLRMPGLDGLDATARIRSAWPHVAVVILTTYNDDEPLVQGCRPAPVAI